MVFLYNFKDIKYKKYKHLNSKSVLEISGQSNVSYFKMFLAMVFYNFNLKPIYLLNHIFYFWILNELLD